MSAEKKGPRIKPEVQLDPRLKGVNLRDACAVYKALGGNEYGEDRFDLQAYLNLPRGKRLLTAAELETLEPGMERPIPDSDDPNFVPWYTLTLHEDNGGENPWDYNWNPQTKQVVYPDDSEIPEHMVRLVKQILGPKAQARQDEIVQGMFLALN